MTAVLDAIVGGRGTALWGLRLGLNAAFGIDDMLFSSAPYDSATLGHFDDKVVSWGGLQYTASDRRGALPAVETRVRVADPERRLQALKSGVYADRLRGVPCTQYLMTPTVAADSFPVFVGILTKLSFLSPFVAELAMRCNDDQLQRLSPRGGWALSRASWPNAKPEVYDHFAPILYGLHDASRIQTGPGLVPTLYVDTVAFRYLICAGRVKSLIRVYVGGAQVTTGFSLENPTRNGRIYSVVKFDADQGTAVVTVDAEGYEDVGDASGTLITNPAEQWAHRLSNFVLGDYKTGAWLSTNALIDSSTLSAAAAVLSSLAARGRDHDIDQRTGIDITARFCTSWRMRCGWTMSGTIAIAADDVFADPYSGTQWNWDTDEMGPFSLVDKDFTVSSRILLRHTPSASQNSFLAALELVDASVDSETQETLELELSESA